MPGGFGDVLELELLDHVLGKGAYTPPTIYLALSTAAPGDDGATIAEPSGNNYSRKQTAAADWSVAAAGASSNAQEIAFAVATGDWGGGANMGWFAAFSAASGGSFLFWGTVTVPKQVLIGQTARFPVGTITVTLD
jgi:hypothetical protein